MIIFTSLGKVRIADEESATLTDLEVYPRNSEVTLEDMSPRFAMDDEGWIERLAINPPDRLRVRPK